jgi:hypothetical protein
MRCVALRVSSGKLAAMNSSNLKTKTVFAVVFALHFLIQFAAWAVADSSGGMNLPWKVFSFPLFYLLHSWATLYFWMVGALNSILWGLAAGLGMSLFPRRKETI